MSHVWEAAKFDDACTVPTPCLLLSGLSKKIYVKAERSRQGVGAGHESSNFAASHYLT